MATVSCAQAQAPRDKLVCVLNCCRVINNLLHVADNDGSEARGEQLSQYKPVRMCRIVQPSHAALRTYYLLCDRVLVATSAQCMCCPMQ